MLEIRRMRAEDCRAAHLIASESLDTFWTEESLRKEVEENKVARYLVAAQNDEIIGFCGAHIIFEEAHIINMAVKEGFRNRGVGNKLLSGLLQYASNLGAGYITLEVRASNDSAKALYKKLGFEKVSIRKGYYKGENGETEDGELMVLASLPEPEADFIESESLVLEE